MHDFKGYTHAFYHAQCRLMDYGTIQCQEVTANARKANMESINRKYSTIFHFWTLVFIRSVERRFVDFGSQQMLLQNFGWLVVVFDVDHYQAVSGIRPVDRWIGRTSKYGYSRWNVTNMLFLPKAISISGLQAPFCFFNGDHNLSMSGIHFWIASLGLLLSKWCIVSSL